ncbi:hypothetical protein HPB50_001481 [Hyalomma asiaticum]|uniref:Uncharacterized protein n=1 Tax=Hyalomma asiaticum TaxID=266040 RepID=A0ACB7RWA5_HYAAI|nr:hypothetical protein HPB50_001481 [Hyalomma asiaticum]
MDSVDALAPSAGVPQQSQPSAASAVNHRVEEIITERWASSSTTSVTDPAPQVDALAASTDPASPTPAPHPATTSNGASEDIMEHDHNEASGWDTVHYRRYTTRRLKGELRSERTELTLTLGSPVEGRSIPVDIVDATHPAEVTSKGVVKIRAEHTEEYIANHIRCESANILDFRIMGKTQMLLITTSRCLALGASRPDYGVYHNLSAVYAEVAALAETYPAYVQVDHRFKSRNGLSQLVVRLANFSDSTLHAAPQLRSFKVRALLLSGQRGGELVTVESVLHFLRQLFVGLSSPSHTVEGAISRKLLSKVDLHVVVLANPDGFNHAERTGDYCFDGTALGAKMSSLFAWDLDRHLTAEAETQVLLNLSRAQPYDAFVAFHSGTREIHLPFKSRNGLSQLVVRLANFSDSTLHAAPQLRSFKVRALLLSGQRGGELVTVESVLHFLRQLFVGLSSPSHTVEGAISRKLLSKVDLHVVVLANPDGFNHAERTGDYCFDGTALGAKMSSLFAWDLDRHLTAEAETQVLLNLSRAQPYDAFVAFHSGTREIHLPYAGVQPGRFDYKPANLEAMTAFAKEIALAVKPPFVYGQARHLLPRPLNGTALDFMAGVRKKTLEELHPLYQAMFLHLIQWKELQSRHAFSIENDGPSLLLCVVMLSLVVLVMVIFTCQRRLPDSMRFYPRRRVVSLKMLSSSLHGS